MIKNFITVEEAKSLIAQHCSALPSINLSLADCLEKILAEDIHSPIDMPGFDQSAMDGYAISFADYTEGKPLPVNGESFAGIDSIFTLQAGSAARIFTGAPVPLGADTVVMQEHTIRMDNAISIEPGKLTRGLNVRKQGSEIKKGTLALPKGSMLRPGAIGYLASVGIDKVSVIATPKVSIIVTGKELVKPGTPLAPGQVYESNSLTLKAALQKINIQQVSVYHADDDVDAMTEITRHALEEADLILIAGGVSVGDYDFVIPALDNCGVKPVFHKVQQRPGKPLFFGKKDTKTIFGLPGNPSSVLSCFYQYVLPAIQKLTGREEPFTRKISAPMGDAFTKAAGLTHFLKAYYNGETVSHLPAQESFRLSSFAQANCLVEIPKDTTVVAKGEIVTAYMIS